MPKSRQPASPSPIMSPDPISDLSSQIAALTKTVNSYATRFDKLEGLLSDVRAENKQLKSVIADRDKEITNLARKLNAQEQYNRSWSVRILNLPIPADDATQPERVMQHVYTKVLEPLLRGAVEKKLLREIPPVERVLETAHILPAKSDSTNPIIARFYTRNIRAMMFRMKKEFAARLPVSATAGRSGGNQREKSAGKYAFPFYEDLTKHNFAKMRAIAQHTRVESCWSVSGILRYKVVGKSEIKKVKDVFESVETIIS